MEEEGKEWIFKSHGSIAVGNTNLSSIYLRPRTFFQTSYSAWKGAAEVYSKDLLSW